MPGDTQKKYPMVQLYKKLFPPLFSLATDVEQVIDTVFLVDLFFNHQYLWLAMISWSDEWLLRNCHSCIEFMIQFKHSYVTNATLFSGSYHLKMAIEFSMIVLDPKFLHFSHNLPHKNPNFIVICVGIAKSFILKDALKKSKNCKFWKSVFVIFERYSTVPLS